MTIQEKNYIRECEEKYDSKYCEVVRQGLEYGLELMEVKQIVEKGYGLEKLNMILAAIKEGADDKVVVFMCEGMLNIYQMQEVVDGLRVGLTLEEIKSYAHPDIKAHVMKKLRKQLEEKKQTIGEKEGAAASVKELMEHMTMAMEHLRQDKERADELVNFLDSHVLEEKNRLIQDLKENLKGQENIIHSLQVALKKKDEVIEEGNQALHERDIKINELTIKLSQEKQWIEDRLEETWNEPDKVRPLGYAEMPRREKPQDSLISRMSGWKKKERGLLTDIAEKEFQPDQLEQIRLAMVAGLPQNLIQKIADPKITAERMRGIIAIMMITDEHRGADNEKL